MAEPARVVIGGVDTHKEIHVAAVIDANGGHLATESFPTTTAGYRALARFLNSHGQVASVGVEGTGSWGAGLARHLTRDGVTVIEVNCTNRQARRRNGKSDPADALAAARAVLSGEAAVVPKSGDGAVESIRMLRLAKRSAMKARTQAANQLHSVIDTAPEPLRGELRSLTLKQLVARASRFRVADQTTPAATTKAVLRTLARRWLFLTAELAELRSQLTMLVNTAGPELVAIKGVGLDIASTLLVAAGDNPERLRSEASFVALCGCSPVDASSGKQNRHRLNRGGNRQANAALYMLVVGRLTHDQRAIAYRDRRIAEGKTKAEAIRCLKRYAAREVYLALLRQLDQNPTLLEPKSPLDNL